MMVDLQTTFWQELKRRFGDQCCLKESLSRYTAYRVGGPADALVVPQTVAALQWLVQYCRQHRVPYRVLGSGTNVLVHDAGYRGVIVLLKDCCGQIQQQGTQLYVGAGVMVSDLVAYCERQRLAGLHFMSGIPGTVGGALVMNAGAFEGEIGDRVIAVDALDARGNRCRISREAVAFGYRQAPGLQGLLLLGCWLQLESGNGEQLRQQRQSILERRAKKQPLNYPSCGSVFKRPPGDFAGRLIERAGGKGLCVGGAMVSPKHANFILNVNHATASDIFELIVQVQQRVYRETGVWLEPEVQFIGFSKQELKKLKKP